MSSKKPAAATAAVKAPRKPRAPGMSPAIKFAVMAHIKEADASLPDATLAEQCTALIGRKITAMQVKGYRQTFNIASVGRPKAGVLQTMLDAANQRIAELSAQLAEATGATA